MKDIKFNTRLKTSNGFTLVELIIVLAIITMLIMIAFFASTTQISKGKDARRKTDIHKISIGLEEYEKDHNCYPSSLGCGDGTVLGPYMGKVPCEPEEPYQSYEYVTEPSTCPSWYWVFTSLSYEQDPDIEEVGCVNGCGPNSDTDYFNFYQSSPNAILPYGVTYPDDGGGGDDGGGLPDDWTKYGCFGDSCLPIEYDPDRPGAVCDPNYNDPQCGGDGCVIGEFQCSPYIPE